MNATRALVFSICFIAAAPGWAFVHPVALNYASLGVTTQASKIAQIHCLALNVYHEARGEPDEGKFAVAAVTMNRVRSKRYPGTVCGVVWQHGQFSWTKDGRSDKPRNARAWKNSLWVAIVAYDFNQPSPVGKATHYHAVHVQPAWASRKHEVRRVGRHVFYAPRRG